MRVLIFISSRSCNAVDSIIKAELFLHSLTRENVMASSDLLYCLGPLTLACNRRRAGSNLTNIFFPASLSIFHRPSPSSPTESRCFTAKCSKRHHRPTAYSRDTFPLFDLCVAGLRPFVSHQCLLGMNVPPQRLRQSARFSHCLVNLGWRRLTSVCRRDWLQPQAIIEPWKVEDCGALIVCPLRGRQID
jgi:hypothetical protein